MKIYKIMILIISVGISINTYGQINPVGSMYFQNQYLMNPAMAGVDQGWSMGAAYKAQWTAIDGAPSMQMVTGEYGSENKKIGVGAYFYNESAGVIRRTSFKATYAYHVQLNQEQTNFLDFGLSAGVMDEWIDFNKVKGDLSDVSLYDFNQRKLYFDGDFGVGYRSSKFNLQASVPNLKRFLKKDILRNVADRALFFVSASYKMSISEDHLSTVEPKIVYRGVQNYKDILDAGANFHLYDGKLLLSGMYHSTNSITFGAGTWYKKQLSILCQYTTNTADLQNYSNGEFEIALKHNFR